MADNYYLGIDVNRRDFLRPNMESPGHCVPALGYT